MQETSDLLVLHSQMENASSYLNCVKEPYYQVLIDDAAQTLVQI